MISITGLSFEKLGENPLHISKTLNKNGRMTRNKNEKIPLEDIWMTSNSEINSTPCRCANVN